MKTKLNLSKSEQQEFNVNAKRLMAAGVIPPEEKPLRQAQMLTLERTGGPLDSFVHAPPTGGYGIVIWVRVVVVKSGVALSGCRLTPRRWDDDDINLMDPTEGVSYYKAIGGVEYPRNDVLNRWISSNRYLKNGKVLEGVVIAQSPRSLPAWCVDGISIEAELCFVDQFDNVYPLNVDLRIMRDTERRDRPSRSTGLFGPAVNASMHATYGEKPDLGGREGISPKEPSVAATKRAGT